MDSGTDPQPGISAAAGLPLPCWADLFGGDLGTLPITATKGSASKGQSAGGEDTQNGEVREDSIPGVRNKAGRHGIPPGVLDSAGNGALIRAGTKHDSRAVTTRSDPALKSGNNLATTLQGSIHLLF